MEGGQASGEHLLKAVAQDIRKEMMVTEPGALFVERDKKQIAPFEVFEQGLEAEIGLAGRRHWGNKSRGRAAGVEGNALYVQEDLA